MTTLIETVLYLLLASLLLPVSVLLVQVLAALRPRRAEVLPATPRPRIAILVPAHNEALGIRSMLAAVLPQLCPDDCLLVVADNCSDETATLARLAGAEVIERFDSERRGKGYALDFGVRHLEKNPPEVVIIVDADCEVTPGAIDRLARQSAHSNRPVQALYLMRLNPAQSRMRRIAIFAWTLKNLVRPLGSFNLGLPCHLTGSGMAFPWPVLQSASLASGHIVEDMKLGVDLARNGKPTQFCPDALVWSTFPQDEEGSMAQRSRWEHGHLGMIAGEGPGLFFDGIKKMNAGLMALALDMCVPPLAFLSLLILAVSGLCGLYAWWSGALIFVFGAVLVVAFFSLAVLLSWLFFGREIISLNQLLMVVFYVLRKVPLYLRFFVRRQVEWVRSKRD